MNNKCFIFNVGVSSCLRFLFSGLSGSNFVCKIPPAGRREAILCAKFCPRVVGKQFRVRNSVRGSSGSNFVCEILSAGRREAILCAKFRQRVVGKQFCVQNSVTRFSPSSSPPPRGCCGGRNGMDIFRYAAAWLNIRWVDIYLCRLSTNDTNCFGNTLRLHRNSLA